MESSEDEANGWTYRLVNGIKPAISARLLVSRNGLPFGVLLLLVTTIVCILKLDISMSNFPAPVRVVPQKEVSMTYLELWRQMQIDSHKLIRYPLFTHYGIVMSEREYNLSLKLLDVFCHTMEENNLTYIIYGGTLLGSYRHHGPIPWDDDIDVMINVNQKDQIRKVFERLEPIYHLYTSDSDWTWKFFSTEGINPFNRDWKWPFIDIWFYSPMKGFIREIYFKLDFQSDVVFPLRKRPYSGLSLYAPSKSQAVLSLLYGSIDMCVSRMYDHRQENDLRLAEYKIPCHYFDTYYPYVYRKELGAAFVEYLVYKDAFVQTLN